MERVHGICDSFGGLLDSRGCYSVPTRILQPLGCRAYRRWIVLLYRVHHRFVDYLATSSAQNDGRDTSVVLFFYHIFGIAYLSEVALPMAHVVLDRHIAGICHHQYIETRNT